MSDLLVEVDEALKAERLEKMWQRYGGFFIGFIAAIIIGTAANAGYHTWKVKQDEAQTAQYLEAVASGQYTPQELNTLASKLHGDFKHLVELQAAGLALESGNKELALEIYKRVAAATPADRTYKDLAAFMVTLHDTDLSDEERADKFTALASDEENAWRYQILLEAALVNATKLNRFSDARMQLTDILEGENIPDTLKQKAKSLDVLYALEEKNVE